MLFSEEDGAVTVTQETESVRQRVVIYGSPVASDKSGNKQNEGAFRLMEVRDQHIRDPEPESRYNDYPCSYLQLAQ